MLVAPLGQFFLCAGQFTIGQRNGAFPPITAEEEAMFQLSHDDFLIDERRSVVGQRHGGVGRAVLANGLIEIEWCRWLDVSSRLLPGR